MAPLVLGKGFLWTVGTQGEQQGLRLSARLTMKTNLSLLDAILKDVQRRSLVSQMFWQSFEPDYVTYLQMTLGMKQALFKFFNSKHQVLWAKLKQISTTLSFRRTMQQPLPNASHSKTKLQYPRIQRGSHRRKAELHPCFVQHDHRLTSPSASIQRHRHDQIWHADELVDDCGFLHLSVRGMRLATRLYWLSSQPRRLS